MILADKIIALRKKNGWSQEQLAEKVNVTRQSVSKWEGAQSVPDLEKLLQLAKVFGVSTDYLLKDEMEEAEYAESVEEEHNVRYVSMEEANAFLHVKAITASRIALGALLCILSPVCLIVLGAAAEVGAIGVTEEFAGGVGMIILLLMVAAAVAIFVFSGSMTSPYEYLEKEVFETEYGVTGMVKERRKQYKDTYTKGNVAGVTLCILSVIPLFVGSMLWENDFILCTMVGLLLLLVGCGVYLFVVVGIQWESMQKLLQEGEYERTVKSRKKAGSVIAPVYWPVVTAIYLGWSFATGNWGLSWIIWPVAAVFYAAAEYLVGVVRSRNTEG